MEKKKKIDWFNIFIILILAVEGWFIFVYERGMPERTKIHDLFVYDALRAKPRLHPWMEYADDIDYWYKEELRAGDKTAGCSFSDSRLIKFTRTPDIYVYTRDRGLEDWKLTLNWCVHHEIGHYIDSILDVSGSEEFQDAVDLTILMLENLPEDREYRWRYIAEGLPLFPGLFGNPLLNEYWGDYGELYAELHDIDYLIEMPPPLRKYFDEFIPWDR